MGLYILLTLVLQTKSVFIKVLLLSTSLAHASTHSQVVTYRMSARKINEFGVPQNPLRGLGSRDFHLLACDAPEKIARAPPYSVYFETPPDDISS